MSGHTPWAKLRNRLHARCSVTPPALPLPLAVNAPWRNPYVIMTAAGHRPSEVADVLGGALCACGQASWSHAQEYGPYGGCPWGWYDARTFLRRYGVPGELRLPPETEAEAGDEV